MAKKISNLDRVVDFFVNGDPNETASAFATVQAIMRSKAKTTEPAKTTRRKRGTAATDTAAAGTSV